jgi:hypothetical protein
VAAASAEQSRNGGMPYTMNPGEVGTKAGKQLGNGGTERGGGEFKHTIVPHSAYGRSCEGAVVQLWMICGDLD